MNWLSRLTDPISPSELQRPAESPEVRRRRLVVVVVTLLVGAVLLGYSLSAPPGSEAFTWLALALATTWVGGSVLSGPLHLGRVRVASRLERPIMQPVLVGLALVAVFVVGALLVAQVPALSSSVERVLDHARSGPLLLVTLITLVNGVGEEMFFRGALFTVVRGWNPVAVTTTVYVLTTVVTGNVMLVFAAGVLGVVVGLERLVSGGVLAPVLTHVTWSLGMLLLLPPLMSALT